MEGVVAVVDAALLSVTVADDEDALLLLLLTCSLVIPESDLELK